MTVYDLVAIGRVGVDLYPLQHGVTLDEVRTFEKFLGGSAANVTVAAARHGRRAALVSATADDAFGRFVHRELLQLGVDDAHVQTISRRAADPGHLLRDVPAGPLPDLVLPLPDRAGPAHHRGIPSAASDPRRPRPLVDRDRDSARSRAEPPHLAAWEERGRAPLTVLDLDYQAVFWRDRDDARNAGARAVRHATVAVGNIEECEVATGESDPERRGAGRCSSAGVELAVVKRGPEACSP